jgi:alpha-L-arabinofuranosidase
MGNQVDHKFEHGERTMREYFMCLGQLCHYYTKIDDRFLKMIVAIKNHKNLANPKFSPQSYQNNNVRKAITKKLEILKDMIDGHNPKINEEYKDVFCECMELKRIRDKLAHWQIMLKDDPKPFEVVKIVKIKQIGFFGKENKFDVNHLRSIVLNAPNLIKQLDKLDESLKNELYGS